MDKSLLVERIEDEGRAIDAVNEQLKTGARNDTLQAIAALHAIAERLSRLRAELEESRHE